MIDKHQIENIVSGEIEGTDIFIVEVKVTPDNRVIVELDSMSGLDIDTCARITRAIEAGVDREVEDYELEVGSAGLTSPFKVRGQYVKNIGNEVEVLTADGRKFSGKLSAVGDDDFTVEVTRKVKEPGAKRPVMVTEPETIPMSMAKKVCYKIDFK